MSFEFGSPQIQGDIDFYLAKSVLLSFSIIWSATSLSLHFKRLVNEWK